MSFSREALGALDPAQDELADVIAGLVRRDVLTVQSDRFAADHGQLRFVQSVLRQVAYDTLSRRDRRAAHLAAAAFLTREDATGELSPIIARHLLDAVVASGEQDDDVAALRESACELLMAAAERALGLGAAGEALRHLHLAFEHADSTQQLQLREELSGAALQAGDLEACLEHAHAALAAIGQAEPRRAARIAAKAGRAYIETRQTSEAIALLEPRLAALDVDDPVNSDAALAVLAELSTAYGNRGDGRIAARYSEQQIEVAERVGDTGAVAVALTHMAIEWQAERPAACSVLFRGAVDLSRNNGETTLLVRALLNLSANELGRDLDSARAASAEAVGLAPRASANWRAYAYLNRIEVLYVAGQWDELRDLLAALRTELRTALDACPNAIGLWVAEAEGRELDTGDLDAPGGVEPAVDSWRWQEQVIATRCRGDGAALVAACNAAIECAFSLGFGDDFALLWHGAVGALLDVEELDAAQQAIQALADAPQGLIGPLVQAQLMRLQGILAAKRGEDPESLLRIAIERLDEFGARPLAARTRHALGDWLVEQGRADEASELLTAARRTYDELGAHGWIAELGASPAAASAA